MSNMNDNRVGEMSESQFKDSLDALIAGEMDDPASRLTPLPSSESNTCPPMAFTSEALHQHQAQAAHQQQPIFNGFQQAYSNHSMPSMAMNLMDSANMFPSALLSHLAAVQNGSAPPTAPSSLSSSSFAVSSEPDLPLYVSSEPRHGSKKQKANGGSSNNKRKKEPIIAPVSEDEGGHLLRKVERNAREQKRSQQIVDQISNLRDLLANSNVPTKADKYSTLVTAAKYIKQLQERSSFLENEQKKLHLTIGQATDVVKNKYVPVASTTEATETVSLDRPKIEHAADEDESPICVHGLDYRDIFLACPVAGAITSIDGRFLDCNYDFEDITGYTKDELFRKPSESPLGEPSERHMSVFNVLKREDMERLFVVMSDMLRKPAEDNEHGSTEQERRETDRWSDRVALNRKENVQVTLSMKLIRQKDGLPRFFSCSLMPR